LQPLLAVEPAAELGQPLTSDQTIASYSITV
jgi:hypothetical protein